MKKLAYIVLSAVIVSVLGFTTISQAKKTVKSTEKSDKAATEDKQSGSGISGRDFATWD